MSFVLVTGATGESSKRTWDLEPARRVLGYSPGFNLDELGVPFGDPPWLLARL